MKINPALLEGTCSAQYTDPAAQLTQNLFSTLAQADCDLANPCDYPPQYNPTPGEEFDFIIVGAGSAGSVLANRLSEIAAWKVLVLEAGGDPTKTSEVPSMALLLQQTDIDWQFKTDPEEPTCLGMEGNICNWPRGKVLGGSSTINAMLYTRGSPSVYDLWEAESNPGWGYRDVLPYFKKSEDMRADDVQNTTEFFQYHGTGGPLKVENFNRAFVRPLASLLADGWAEMGYPFNPDCNGRFQAGFATIQGTLEDGRRCNTAKAFLSQIKSRRNLKVSKFSLVTRILINKSTKTAYGVEFINRKGETVRVIARKEVILSAGSIKTPQLLMLSGVGPRDNLREVGIDVIADLPVGENLQDHAISPAIMLTLDYSVPPTNQTKDMFDFLMKQDSILSSRGVSSYNTFVETENRAGDNPDFQFYFSFFGKNSSTALQRLLTNFNYRNYIKNQYLQLNSESAIIVPFLALLKPKSRGRVKLISRNPMEQPKIISGYLSDPRDVESFSRAYTIMQKFSETRPLRSKGVRYSEVKIDSCSKYTANSRPFRDCLLRYTTVSINHQVGTCKMGPPNRADSVVDAHLRVKGINRLRVIDASIMPIIPTGTTNAPTIMIGEKGSDLIKQTWLSYETGHM
ncbi:glucose dehydrogenase [FAD, quinone]-like isoform X2 [Macrosteles quadrilineatus]|uniref:glucose dehydrogenase [FAD, quinone]-like isoform X2 n=1 Tax=Macrosteles quadrilineatus TaxID=74068 RepID=UPI0023E31014|nr:glucose dehydrogenase [FAD, quinone]-like isoform X2 [Macrosteles quadrilineatus]